MPRLKIIYLLRDPIDRMWSDLAMFHDQRFGGAGTGTVSDAVDFAFLARRRNLQHSRYEENLRNWEASFPQDQIFVGLLEELSAQPDQLLQRIFTFLGVAPDHQPPEELVRSKINVANYPKVPGNIANQLASKLETDLRALHQRLQRPHTAMWLTRMEALLTERARKEDCVAS